MDSTAESSPAAQQRSGAGAVDVAAEQSVAALPSEAGGSPAEVPLEQPVGKLSFREHLWDQFELVWRKRVEPSRRQLDVYVTCLRERAQLEKQYAKGLERCVQRIQAEAQQGTLPTALEALSCNLWNRAEQCVHLADELEQDVVCTIEAMLRQHGEVSKFVFADGQKLTRHWQDARQSHKQSTSKYAQACLEAEQGARDCLGTAALRPSSWKKLAERSVGLSRMAAGTEKDYLKAVQRVNSLAEFHARHMGSVLSALQDMEEKRASCFHDAAMKIAVYDTSWLRNVQYDLDSAVQSVESADADAELQQFIVQNQSQAPPPSKQLIPQPFGGELHAAGRALPPVEEAAVAQQLEAVRPICAELLRPGVGSDFVDKEQESLAQLRQRLGETPEGSASCRTALCKALRELLQTEAEQQLEELPAVRLGSAAFDAVVSLVKAALDGCDRAGDAWNGRDLMVLARKFQSESQDARPVDALLRVYTHPLWSRVTFWEDVLLVGLAEAHSLQALRRRDLAVGAELQEVAMTVFLRRYVGYMETLGIKPEQAKGCVQRTLRKHSQLLGDCAEVYLELLQGNSAGSPAVGPSGAAAAPEALAAPGAAPAASAVSANLAAPISSAVAAVVPLASDAAASNVAPAAPDAAAGEWEHDTAI